MWVSKYYKSHRDLAAILRDLRDLARSWPAIAPRFRAISRSYVILMRHAISRDFSAISCDLPVTSRDLVRFQCDLSAISARFRCDLCLQEWRKYTCCIPSPLSSAPTAEATSHNQSKPDALHVTGNAQPRSPRVKLKNPRLRVLQNVLKML